MILWFLSPLLLRKSGGKTSNKANTKKALAESQPIFKPKSPFFPDWLTCRDDTPVHHRWLSLLHQKRAKAYNRYRPGGLSSEIWPLVVPGQLPDELVRGHPNHHQRGVCWHGGCTAVKSISLLAVVRPKNIPKWPRFFKCLYQSYFILRIWFWTHHVVLGSSCGTCPSMYFCLSPSIHDIVLPPPPPPSGPASFHTFWFC